MSRVGLERVCLQLVVGLEAEPVARGRGLCRQELRGQVGRKVVLTVRFHGGQIAAVSERKVGHFV